MQAACTVLFSGAFAFQTFCGLLLAELPQPDPGEALFIQRIAEYWKEGHVEDAKEQLRKYLSDYPASPYLNEIRKMLGDTHLQEGSLEQALAYFEKITAPPRIEAKEALFLRRITEYWKEGHYEDAKKQLKAYLSSYPSSTYLSEILAMLGDLYLHEGSLKEAIDCYEKISSDRCEHLTAVNRAEALYHLKRYDDLLLWESIHPYLIGNNERIHLLLADTHYRKVLQEINPDNVQQHATAALGHFSQINQLDKGWKLIVAYLTALQGEKTAAAELYLSLANEWPEKKEDCLYHAASLLNVKEPKKAISLLQELGKTPTKYQKEAAFNELCLLYREKRYGDFIEREKSIGHLVDPRFSSYLTFYKATSSFHLEKFEEAANQFKLYLQSSPTSIEEIRYALQNLFFCGYKTAQPALVDFAIDHWKTRLPFDEGYLEGLLASAELSLKEKNYQVAATRFSEIVERFPSNLVHETALFNYAQVLLSLDNLEEGQKTLQSYLSRYPNTPRAPLAWQNLVYASMEILKKSEKGHQEALKANLALILEQAIKAAGPSNEDNTRLYRLHLTQLVFELGQCKEALAYAEDYLRLYSDHPSSRETRLIQISCHLTLGSPVESLIESFEAALQNESDPQIQSRLHLQLFNAYLTIEDYDSAAKHLLSVYKDNTLSIKAENLLWLAEQVQKHDDLTLAKDLLEKILCTEINPPLVHSSLNPLSIEEGAIQLKDIYLALGSPEKACDLLLHLVNLQKNDPSINWNFPRKVRFELAELLVSLKQNEEAMKIYDQLIGDAAFSQASFYLRSAILNRAKLQWKTLDEEEKGKESPLLTSILDTFKDLQIAKNVESEPVHIEAALEYAAIRSQQTSLEEQPKRMLFYLERIKEDFSSGSSDLAITYLQQKTEWPKQAELIEHYLCYISAEVLRLQALLESKAGDQAKALSLEAESKDTLQQLTGKLSDSASLLQERVSHTLALLDEASSMQMEKTLEPPTQTELED
jgi:TolA-binding protein